MQEPTAEGDCEEQLPRWPRTKFLQLDPRRGGPDEPLRSSLQNLIRSDEQYFRDHSGTTEFLRPFLPGEFWPEADPGSVRQPAVAVLVIRRRDGGHNRRPLIQTEPFMADAAYGWWSDGDPPVAQ